MQEILTALMIWIGANTYFNTNHDVPQVIFLPQEQLNHMYYKDLPHDGNTLHGLYDKDTDTIYLPDTWDRRKPWDNGVLLHEILHYLQDMNKMQFNCTKEMERDVWPIQKNYLKKVHNFDWDYDELWYMVISTCDPTGL